jgi:hypothetical protein
MAVRWINARRFAFVRSRSPGARATSSEGAAGFGEFAELKEADDMPIS